VQVTALFNVGGTSKTNIFKLGTLDITAKHGDECLYSLVRISLLHVNDVHHNRSTHHSSEAALLVQVEDKDFRKEIEKKEKRKLGVPSS